MSSAQRETLRVGMVGHAFMGRAHSQAWRSLAASFDVPLTPVMSVLCGRNGDRAARAAFELGWSESSGDWRDLVDRDDIDLIDICTPVDTHAEIALAALAAGKHVLCEKPLATTLAEATEMATAASGVTEDGIVTMTGFNYRRVPAIELARRLVAGGRLGTIRHVRAAYLQDWLADPTTEASWRLDASRAGSGALGDIGAHAIDLAQHVIDDRIDAVTGMLRTFVRRRPDDLGRMTEVTVDDACSAIGRFAGGATATFEATRMAQGRRNALRLEVNGEYGTIEFDLERLNELRFHDATLPTTEQGMRTILVTQPGHPWLEGWWPPGHVLGWEHTFTHEFHDLVQAIADGTTVTPSFADGLQVQSVLEAIARSAVDGRWQQPQHIERSDLG